MNDDHGHDAGDVALEETARINLHLCTGSVGLAAAPSGLDEALHRAKELGRNRVEIDGELVGGLDEMLAGGPVPQDSMG